MNTEDVRVLNDGLHSKRQLDTIHQFFTTNDLKGAVLYHVILSGRQEKTYYQATMRKLMQHIRTKCRAEYIGAYEVGDEKGGLHCHAFVLIEAAYHFPSDLMDVREGGFIARRIKNKDRGHSIRIEPPKNRMHGGAMFARMNTPAKLENCINWCTYTVKPRSKEGVPGREVYFGSQFVSNIEKREAQRQKHRDAVLKSSKTPDASPLAVLSAPVQPNERKPDETRTTPDGNRSTEASTNTEAGAEASRLDSLPGSPASQEQSDHGPEACSTLPSSDRSGGNAPGSATSRRPGPGPARPEAEPDHGLAVEAPTTGYQHHQVALVTPKAGVYNCLTNVTQSYTARPTL